MERQSTEKEGHGPFVYEATLAMWVCQHCGMHTQFNPSAFGCEHQEAPPTTAEKIHAVCERIEKMLLEKNKAYGDSALDPLRVFSRASTDEQIRVRIDDKLSRLARGGLTDKEDVVLDLVGYLVLLLVARENMQ